MVKENDLYKRLKAFGLQFFAPEEEPDANAALADLAASHDTRLVETFPALFFISAENGLLDYAKARGQLKDPAAKARFDSLAAMSLALCKSEGVRLSLAKELVGLLGGKGKKEYKEFLKHIKRGEDLKLGASGMSVQRLKDNLNMYLKSSGARRGELLAAKDELGVEYAMSQVLSPKQKELFFKKLKGEKLTKTEREYYSRVVRKKVLALANSELHRMARSLQENAR